MRYLGFLKPFDTFSNQVYKPNLDPAHLPFSYEIHAGFPAPTGDAVLAPYIHLFSNDPHLPLQNPFHLSEELAFPATMITSEILGIEIHSPLPYAIEGKTEDLNAVRVIICFQRK